MNIQNIVALANQLQLLGFQDTGSLLLKRVCFKPGNFYLFQRVNKEKEIMLFSLYFERLQKDNSYALQYYDVTLQKDNIISASPVDGINPLELEKQMAAIDWKKAFNLDDKKSWNPEDKSTWDTELKIFGIVENLSFLENSEKGKVVASTLKQKFWTDTSYNEITCSISLVKNKADVSQRFYFSEDGLGITVDEAYRFLQNKWLEKQMLQKRKQVDDKDEVNEEANNGANGNSLLRKKRIAGIGKRNKAKHE